MKYFSVLGIYTEKFAIKQKRCGEKVMNQNISIDFGKFHYSYGTSLPKPNDLNVRHCHDFYEILYVIDGKGKLVIEGREYPLFPHTLVVIPPLEYHYVDLNTD